MRRNPLKERESPGLVFLKFSIYCHSQNQQSVMTGTDKPQTANASQTHTNHVPAHWHRWQTFRASKKQQFQMKLRFQLGFLWFWKAACFPSQPEFTHTCFYQTWTIQVPLSTISQGIQTHQYAKKAMWSHILCNTESLDYFRLHEGGGDAKSAGAACESSFGAAEFSLTLLGICWEFPGGSTWNPPPASHG